MKKVISLLLALVLCLSLCACYSGKKLTTTDVEEALVNCDGTLNMETSGDKVTSFTYVVENVNADDLMDKEYTRKAIYAMLSGDTSKITIGQLQVCKAISPLVNIEALFESEDDFDAEAFVGKMLSIVCDAKTVEYDGWAVFTKVDQDNDRIVINVVSE